MKRAIVLGLAVAAAVAVGVGACGPGQKASLIGAIYVGGSVGESGGAFYGGSPIGKATISIGGTQVATANEQGFFFVNDVPTGDRVSVCFSAPGYVTQCRNVAIRAGQPVRLSPTEMLPASTPVTLSGGQGTITQGLAQATMAPGTLCKADRTTPITGDVACSVTPLDPTGDDLTRAPGSYLGKDSSGKTVSLETGGMLDVSCVATATSERVDVCTGKTASVRIQIFSGCANESIYPATMKSWGFNRDSGLWEEDANFTKTCSGDSGYYEGTASHFSYWNADNPITTSCLHGKITDPSGRAVDGARIQCSGTNYQGSSEAYSSQDGTFCAPAKAGGQYRCVAAKGGFASAPITGTAPAAAAACGDSSCADVGTLQLKDPLVESVLTWGQNPSDLDSHVELPDGSEVYYSNQGDLAGPPFIALDTDDTSSYGPEIISFMPMAAAGTYRYCIYNYSGEGSGPIAASGATVELLAGGQQRTYTVPTSNPNGSLWWRVYDITLNGNSIGIQDINALADTCK